MQKINEWCKKYNIPEEAKEELLKIVKGHTDKTLYAFTFDYSKMMKEIEAKLRELSGKNKCKVCGEVNLATAEFCIRCECQL